KVYFGLLALGLVALLLDRCVFTPASAEASDQASDLLITKAPPTSKESPAPVQKPSSTAPAGNPVGLKLSALSESMHLPQASVKDAFCPSQEWVNAATPPPPPSPAKPVTPAPVLPRFDQTHTLSGVMLSESSGAAMVDGKLVRIGQSIDGFKLVSV